ncbi:MAG: hypothetical protein HHAS10_02630 [Candidatus Altimarinota bacterium]
MLKYILLFGALLSLASCTNSPPPAGSSSSLPSASVSSETQGKESVLYVDVREDSEWTAGHIEGAMHVKLGDIEAGNFSIIPKNTPVNLYCRSGRRSAIAYNILKNAGYTNIRDVGGMDSIQNVKIVQ